LSTSARLRCSTRSRFSGLRSGCTTPRRWGVIDGVGELGQDAQRSRHRERASLH
jgi:hypothetical protein